jgi:hypothetical protein
MGFPQLFPAKAGIQKLRPSLLEALEFRFRGKERPPAA